MNSQTTQAMRRPESRAGEGGMTLLLTALMTLVAVQLVFALPLSAGPGLSAENALLYVVAGALAFKIGVQQNFRFELRELHVCFLILLIYAAVSIAAVALIVQYPSYKVLKAIMSFKARMADQFVFFAVFFYAVRASENALKLLKVLLLLSAFANFGALLDAWGYIQVPGLVERDDGRAQGIMGESNQSAAFMACFLPGLVAFALLSSGLSRLIWLGGVLVSVVAMIISASRGGILALVVAAIWGMVYFRRYVSARSIATIAGFGVLILAISLPMIVTKYGGLLANRFIADSSSIDLANVSSGRLEFWAGALSVMAESPLSFATGYGWGMYEVMPFRYATHNHYLSLWFDLGLVGLICGTAILVLAARAALKAIPLAIDPYRSILIAFAIGTLAIAIATFFVNLYTPWLWYWAYAGLVMRIAVNQRVETQRRTREAVSAPPQKSARDSYGWVGTVRR